MPDSESQAERERRQAQRRSAVDRRFGERRQPERAVAGRRVVFANDRRMAERRVVPSMAFSPA
jgi:hypothetical protein